MRVVGSASQERAWRLLREDDWQATITDLATRLQWTWTHARPGRTVTGWRTPIQGRPGYPDLTLVRPPRLLFVEVKTQTEDPDADQRWWLDRLARVPGVEVYVWRPSDVADVQRLLR